MALPCSSVPRLVLACSTDCSRVKTKPLSLSFALSLSLCPHPLSLSLARSTSLLPLSLSRSFNAFLFLPPPLSLSFSLSPPPTFLCYLNAFLLFLYILIYSCMVILLEVCHEAFISTAHVTRLKEPGEKVCQRGSTRPDRT